jgi:ABC-type amino acid transport substrate-binding protein
MRKTVLTLMVLSLLAFLGGASALAQQASGPAQHAKTKAHAARHAMHHAVHHHAVRRAANPEAKYQMGIHSASGTLATVDANGKLLIVTESDGTPFDFVVTRATHIRVNGQKSTLASLAGQTNQQVTVRFRDHLRRGLVAQSVQVGG